jgi:hypothetical protein
MIGVPTLPHDPTALGDTCQIVRRNCRSGTKGPETVGSRGTSCSRGRDSRAPKSRRPVAKCGSEYGGADTQMMSVVADHANRNGDAIRGAPVGHCGEVVGKSDIDRMSFSDADRFLPASFKGSRVSVLSLWACSRDSDSCRDWTWRHMPCDHGDFVRQGRLVTLH